MAVAVASMPSMNPLGQHPPAMFPLTKRRDSYHRQVTLSPIIELQTPVENENTASSRFNLGIAVDNKRPATASPSSSHIENRPIQPLKQLDPNTIPNRTSSLQHDFKRAKIPSRASSLRHNIRKSKSVTALWWKGKEQSVMTPNSTTTRTITPASGTTLGRKDSTNSKSKHPKRKISDGSSKSSTSKSDRKKQDHERRERLSSAPAISISAPISPPLPVTDPKKIEEMVALKAFVKLNRSDSHLPVTSLMGDRVNQVRYFRPQGRPVVRTVSKSRFREDL